MNDWVLLSGASVALLLFFIPTLISLGHRSRKRRVERLRAESFDSDLWSFEHPEANPKKAETRSSDRWVLN